MHAAIQKRALGASFILSLLLAACSTPREGTVPGVEPARPTADARTEPEAIVRGTSSQPGPADAGTPGAELAAAPDPVLPPPETPQPDGGSLPPGACTPDDKRCGPGSFPETCSAAGVWVAEAQPCPFVCRGRGVCGGDCQPGARKCGDPPGTLTPYLCDEGGRWVAEAPCQNLCSSGSCAGSCMPGTSRCDGTRRQMCSGIGTWETIETCPFVCTGGGQCTGECKPGTRSCNGTTPRTCDEAGRWAAGNTCQAPANGSARCEGGACALTCPNGMCGSGCCQCNDNSDCPGRACVSGSCAGECSPGARGCAGTTPQTCNGMGRWVAGSACQAPAHGSARCEGGACAVSCSNGMCGSGCCECNANSDCTSGNRRACVGGRCVESLIQNVAYDVEGAANGQTICPNANPPGGCPRQAESTGACNGKASCALRVSWQDAFGGGGDLGGDPCPFIVKNVYNLRYTCSHDGTTRSARPRDFITPTSAGCAARVLDTVTLSCP